MSADTARFEQRTFSGPNPRRRERARFATRDAGPVIPPLEFPRPQIEDTFRRSMGPQEPISPVAVLPEVVPKPPEAKPKRWFERGWVKWTRVAIGSTLIAAGVVVGTSIILAPALGVAALVTSSAALYYAAAGLTALALAPLPLLSVGLITLGVAVGGSTLKPVGRFFIDKGKQLGNWFWRTITGKKKGEGETPVTSAAQPV